MKVIVKLVILAALVAGVSSNAVNAANTVSTVKHCVTKKNEHGVNITTCNGKIVPSHHLEKKRTCVTKTTPEGKKIKRPINSGLFY